MNDAALVESAPPDLVLSSGLAALNRAATIEQTLNLHDRFFLFHRWLKERGATFEQQFEAAYLKLCAERKLGRLLLNASDTEHRRLRDQITGQMRGQQRTLPEGIRAEQSHRWQRFSRVPDDVFEAWVEQRRVAEKELTQSGLLSLAKLYVRKPELNTDECAAPSDCDREQSEGDTSAYTREVKLYPTVAEREELVKWEDVGEVLGTTTLTSTVLECFRSIRRAARQEMA